MAADLTAAAQAVLAGHQARAFCCSADRGPCSALDRGECGKPSCGVCAPEPWRFARAAWPCPPVTLARAALPQPLSPAGAEVGWDGPADHEIRTLLGVPAHAPTVEWKKRGSNHVIVHPPTGQEVAFYKTLAAAGFIVEQTDAGLLVFGPVAGV